jgi:hypothetical protein
MPQLMKSPALRRLRFAPVVVAGGALAAALLAASTTGTLSGFVASIANSTNTAASGVLTMKEVTSAGATPVCTSTDATTVSTNSATCTTLDDFGGTATYVPGKVITTTVTITNTGTVPANTFTLTPGACVQSANPAATVSGNASDLCTHMFITIANQGGTTVVGSTQTSLTSYGTSSALSLGTLAAGASTTFTITVTMDSAAGNTYQGLQAKVPLTWTFNS